MDKGLPPYHARSLDEQFFSTSIDTLTDLRDQASELAQRDNNDHWAWMMAGQAHFALRDVEAAQACFSSVYRTFDHPMCGAIRFDKPFFDEISKRTDEDLEKNLVSVETVKSVPFEQNDILYMSCNAHYFEAFAKLLLLSLNEVSQHSQVHIHLMDSPPDHVISAREFCARLKNVQTAVSVERPDFSGKDFDAKRSYFHAIRFIRFYSHLRSYGKTLWLMDVDGLFHHAPDRIFDGFSNADVAMRVRPGRLEPWNQFNACLVGVRPNAKGLKYIHDICAYLIHFYEADIFPWGIDQLAMYACFYNLQSNGIEPSIHLLDEKALDYEYIDDGILWCSSGTLKHTAPSQGDLESDPNATPFDKAFAHYSSLACQT